MLVQSAWSAIRKPGSYLRARFLRLKARRGPMKAIVAVAAKLLTAIYFIIRDKVDYRDLGASHFEKLDRTRATRRHVRQLEALGYTVELKAAA
jgi:hypothetical protein